MIKLDQKKYGRREEVNFENVAFQKCVNKLKRLDTKRVRKDLKERI
jgi:hypothetical protein